MNQNVFKLRLANVMKDIGFERWQGGMRRGKLDHRSLAKIAVKSNRIFRQKVDTDTHQHNVLFLLDISGSMYAWDCNYEGQNIERIRAAMEIMKFLGQALDDNGIEYSCLAFNEMIYHYKRAGDGQKTQKWLDRLDRHRSPMYNIDYPSEMFDSSWNIQNNISEDSKDWAKLIEDSGQMESLREHCKNGGKIGVLHGNADIIAIREAQKIVARTPGRNLVIVISDGRPACDYDYNPSKGIHYNGRNREELVTEVRALESQCKVFAVNIGNAQLSDFYSHYSKAATADNVRQDMVTFLTANISR